MQNNKKAQKQKAGAGNKPPAKAAAAPFSSVPSAWWIGISLVLTLVAYLPVFNNGFVTWDDPDYVINNPYIRDLSSLQNLLFKPVQGNYHPLTMLSLAFNYAIGGLDPLSYHVLNLLLHLANVLLVFYFVRSLTSGKTIIAFITALLFGIHPMHVESVAWVTERKDVLYTFFFLLGLIAYLRYFNTGRTLHLALCFLWALLSILSKPAAIIFPAVLFCLDFFLKRKLSARSILEKIPFLLVSVLFIWLTISQQDIVGATDNKAAFGMERRIFFGFYGLVVYFVKAVLPIQQSAFYPFPPINESLPFIYYLSPVLVLALAGLAVWALRKTNAYAFGLLFYAVNLLLVLQFYIVGSAIIAERYTYVPYIGLFFIAGYAVDQTITRYPGWKPVVAAAVCLIAIILTAASYGRSKVWKNDITLWEDAVKYHPSSRGMGNIALAYKKEGDTLKALEYLGKAIGLNIADAEAFLQRGNIYFYQGKLDTALANYNKVLGIDPNRKEGLVNRASVLARQSKYDQALADFARAEQVDSSFDDIYINRGITYQIMGKPAEAIRDFDRYLRNNPAHAGIINSKGLCIGDLGDYQGAIKEFDKAIALEQNPSFYLNRSFAWYKLKEYDKALADANKAQTLGGRLNPNYLNVLQQMNLNPTNK